MNCLCVHHILRIQQVKITLCFPWSFLGLQGNDRREFRLKLHTPLGEKGSVNGSLEHRKPGLRLPHPMATFPTPSGAGSGAPSPWQSAAHRIALPPPTALTAPAQDGPTLPAASGAGAHRGQWSAPAPGASLLLDKAHGQSTGLSHTLCGALTQNGCL